MVAELQLAAALTKRQIDPVREETQIAVVFHRRNGDHTYVYDDDNALSQIRRTSTGRNAVPGHEKRHIFSTSVDLRECGELFV